MPPSENPAFVFIHGAWSNHHTWDKVVAILANKGFASVAIDLPGAGANAAVPQSFRHRPLDREAFAAEPSPNGDVTQEERTAAVLNSLEKARTLGNGKVILVGHSLGGLTLNHVGEAAPEQLHALVYLSAFMLPRGMDAVEFIRSAPMSDAVVPSLFMADPEGVGAMRIDPTSDDPDYVAAMREAFCADASEEDFELAKAQLHPDEPAQVATVQSPITPERFGCVPRHYICCSQDKAITIAGQKTLVSLVDTQLGNQTNVHVLDSSHEPFLSMPEAVCDILVHAAQSPHIRGNL